MNPLPFKSFVLTNFTTRACVIFMSIYVNIYFNETKKQIIIFTDLDGSLLDKDTFKFDEIEDYFKDLISRVLK